MKGVISMETKSRRETSVYIKVSKEEREEFKRLAEETGLTISSYLRMMIYSALKEKGIK
jgi:antitoxin component of RelBE/YafQ-DinJ toxin-antitoxin module